ncbi:MAG: hypothetical protein JO182_07030 [Acidobacteriaceae bacterium]|nr:hypothetical protein [Acidobacteriaceae bacterium]
MMEGRDRIESLGRFEIAAAREEDQPVGVRTQACGAVLKRRRKVEVSFALGTIEERRRFKHLALDAVQDLHARHRVS